MSILSLHIHTHIQTWVNSCFLYLCQPHMMVPRQSPPFSHRDFTRAINVEPSPLVPNHFSRSIFASVILKEIKQPVRASYMGKPARMSRRKIAFKAAGPDLRLHSLKRTLTVTGRNIITCCMWQITMYGANKTYRQRHEGWLGFTSAEGGVMWDTARLQRWLEGALRTFWGAELCKTRSITNIV